MAATVLDAFVMYICKYVFIVVVIVVEVIGLKRHFLYLFSEMWMH